ncbi:MAG: radical SAM protein [Desulfurococcaceae archaeon]
MVKPDSIVWLITGRCNLNCPYCYASLYRNERELSLVEIEKIVKDASENSIEYINITGGEPLLLKNLVEIVKLVKDYGIEVSVFSNLHLLNQDLATKLSRYVDYFLTTIDGPREVYETIKGANTWSKFVNNIKILREIGVEIHVNIPVSKINYRRIDEAIEKTLELDIHSISIIPVIATGRAFESKTYVSSIEFKEALILANNVCKKYSLTITAWCSPFIGVFRDLSNIRFGNCRDWNVIDLTPSGNVVLCDVTGLVITNIIRDGVVESWRKLCRFRESNRINQIPFDCSKCWFSNNCRGGCYARSYLISNSFNKPDPLCPINA